MNKNMKNMKIGFMHLPAVLSSDLICIIWIFHTPMVFINFAYNHSLKQSGHL